MTRIVPTVKNYILNKELLNEIDEGLNSKICYIKSPSGNGKTSLMAKWLEDKNFNNIYWYSLKKIDNIPLLFYRNFFGGLKNMLQTKEFTDTYERFFDSIITSEEMGQIANAIGNIQLTFVIDDFHNLSFEVINLLKAFINNTGYKIRFLIASRDKIPKELSDMLIRQEIYYIENKYAFGFNETKEFFESRNIKLSDSNINKIISYTNGWIPAYVSIAFGIARANTDIFEYNDEYLTCFIKQTVWDEYDSNTKNIFRLGTINNNEISVDMTCKILDIEKSIVLDIIARESHFLIKSSDRKYIISPIMVDFIQKNFNDSLKRNFNKRIAKYFYDKKKYAASVSFYSNALEYDELVKPLTKLVHKNNYLDYSEVRYALHNIPNHIVFKNPDLIMGMIVDSFNSFDLKSVKFYFDKLNGLDQLFDSSVIDKIKKYLLLYNLSLDNKAILEMFNRLNEKNTINRIATVNPCYLFPSVLRGLRDFSYIFQDIIKIKNIKQILEKLLGEFGPYAYEMGIAEAKLETGYLNEAIFYASSIITDTKMVPVEIHLIGTIIMLRGLILLNQPDKALNLLNSVQRRLIDDDYKHLLPNCRALFAKYYMAINENNLVNNWLSNQANIDLEKATFKDYYILKTKAKILFEKKDYTDSLIIINFLIRRAIEYKRIVDLGEYYYVKSSILNYLDDINQSVDYLNKSISIFEPINYKTIYYEYGTLGIKTLEDSLKYIREGKKSYVELILAKKDLYIKDKIASTLKIKGASELTTKEIKVLKLIDKAYSNDEIAKELNISVTTVKTHISNIFYKLGVKNRFQAVKIAKEIDAI